MNAADHLARAPCWRHIDIGTAGVSLSVAGNGNYRLVTTPTWWLEPTAGFRFIYSDFADGSAAVLGLKDGHDWRVQGGVRVGNPEHANRWGELGPAGIIEHETRGAPSRIVITKNWHKDCFRSIPLFDPETIPSSRPGAQFAAARRRRQGRLRVCSWGRSRRLGLVGCGRKSRYPLPMVTWHF
jgi:hypothetical protein